jgi:hypothetical protein
MIKPNAAEALDYNLQARFAAVYLSITHHVHYATSRKVAGSIPDGVMGIFHRHNPSGRTMALGSTQPLAEMSTRNISCGVKSAGA